MTLRDPESIYYWAIMSAMVGETERAFDLLETTVDRGWMCHRTVAKEPLLDQLRTDPRMSRILREMETRHLDAAAAFDDAGGRRVLGLKS